MVMEHGLSRRQLLKIGAGCSAAVALTPLTPFGTSNALAAAGGGTPNGKLVPKGKIGTITFTQRDVPGRLGISTGTPSMGYLGGANFPADPSDLGPKVPLPGGWKELFEYFALVGISQVEFAGYGQNAANPGGAAPNPVVGAIQGVPGSGAVTAESAAAYLAYARTLRGFLDDNGLEAIGNHGFIPSTWNGPNSPAVGAFPAGQMMPLDRDRLNVELEFATILGMPFMGTGSDPTSANNRNVEPWTIAGEKWTTLNEISTNQFGIQMYTHNHAEAYHFLQDGPMVQATQDRVTGAAIAPTMVRAESGKRLMQHYLDVTDPGLVVVELDVYWAHVAQHRFRWYYNESGQRVESILDPVALVSEQTKRFALYHAKDGDRTAEPVGVGNGYTMVPFGDATADIDYRTFLRKQGAKGWHNPNYEQDNAPGRTDAQGPSSSGELPDPGRSLRFTAISAANMGALRG